MKTCMTRAMLAAMIMLLGGMITLPPVSADDPGGEGAVDTPAEGPIEKEPVTGGKLELTPRGPVVVPDSGPQEPQQPRPIQLRMQYYEEKVSEQDTQPQPWIGTHDRALLVHELQEALESGDLDANSGAVVQTRHGRVANVVHGGEWAVLVPSPEGKHEVAYMQAGFKFAVTPYRLSKNRLRLLVEVEDSERVLTPIGSEKNVSVVGRTFRTQIVLEADQAAMLIVAQGNYDKDLKVAQPRKTLWILPEEFNVDAWTDQPADQAQISGIWDDPLVGPARRVTGAAPPAHDTQPPAVQPQESLSFVLEQLYPDIEVRLYTVRDAILIRGETNSSERTDEILEIAQEYFPNVINQMRVKNARPAESKPKPQESAAITIPAGMRVVTITVKPDALAELAQGGSTVDVLLTYGHRSPEGVTETRTETLMSGVRLFQFRLNAKKDRANVSLLVKPEHVRAVRLAEEVGTLSLSLNPVSRGADPSTMLNEPLSRKLTTLATDAQKGRAARAAVELREMTISVDVDRSHVDSIRPGEEAVLFVADVMGGREQLRPLEWHVEFVEAGEKFETQVPTQQVKVKLNESTIRYILDHPRYPLSLRKQVDTSIAAYRIAGESHLQRWDRESVQRSLMALAQLSVDLEDAGRADAAKTFRDILEGIQVIRPQLDEHIPPPDQWKQWLTLNEFALTEQDLSWWRRSFEHYDPPDVAAALKQHTPLKPTESGKAPVRPDPPVATDALAPDADAGPAAAPLGEEIRALHDDVKQLIDLLEQQAE